MAGHGDQMVRNGCIVWFTGLSASGKTTLCIALAKVLSEHVREHVVLDGDVIRRTISSDLGFSREDREENIRRIGDLAFKSGEAGSIVLVAAISPYREIRESIRHKSPVPFFEIFVDAPLSVCEQRDPKGLYRRARAGTIVCFTGIDDVYEAPEAPDVRCFTAQETVEKSCLKVIGVLEPWLARERPRTFGAVPDVPVLAGRKPS
jgi:adenylylsulfate kinase